MLGVVVGVTLAALFGALVIWLVAKMGLGIKVAGFGSAFLAALTVAVVGGLVTALLGVLGVTIGSGLVGAIVHFVVAAIVLLIAGRLLPGFEVKGFGGAMVGAISMAVVAGLLRWVLAAFLHL
ncbi:hypothetical protein PROP_01256 [Propionicimonas sp. T2.31MG-18]|uniref:phage holin family protein n=1 Tax=Propionicimonas sp. T2.31MG-18 TaxID=3157620 RepID=UPI0035E97772